MVLSVSGICKSYLGEPVLIEGTMRLESREKVALVGRNGSGKTTLLRIITGEEEPDRGSVFLARGVTIGYLRQHSKLNPNLSVIQEAESARAHLLELQDRMRILEQKLERSSSADDLEEYTMLQEHFTEQGGYSAETDVRTVLQRMGFSETEFDKSVSALSGGEVTRLTLAKMLLEEPELLILDEPTNHLDLEATEWLESWLENYRGAALIVSHDRTFLQRTAQRIIEVRDGSLHSYPGPFEHYLDLREAEDAYLAEVAKEQKKEIAKMDEFVRRFINSQRTAQALGRQKLLNRLKAKAIEGPAKEKQMGKGFGKVTRSGDLVLETKALSHSFDERKLFENLDWTVRFGERWGVIGGNGSGKSTLIKICLGHISPKSGSKRLGSAIKLGYFSQDNIDLDLTKSPVEILNDRLRMELGAARNLLGQFLISGDDALRPAGSLSGGERNKLALAMLTAQNPNLLVLDEPTNHLDMASREALAEVLAQYEGTLILISHDRWLLEHTTDHTLDIRKDKIVMYPGNYVEYRRSMKSKSEPNSTTNKRLTPPSASPKSESAFAYLTPRELSKEIGRVEKLVQHIENEVSDQESKLESIEREMAQPTADSDILTLSLAHQSISQAIEQIMVTWERHARDLEELRALQGS